MTKALFALPKVLHFAVAQQDIDRATCNSRTDCVLAINIRRELGDAVGRVRVCTAHTSIEKDGYRYYYRVPQRACRLIVDFDAHREVKPINYRLRFTNRTKIQEVPPDRKAQINKTRQLRAEALAAVGAKPKTYPKGRYGI